MRATTVTPTITILMPSFNQGRYLDAALRSVADQRYPNTELIVVDGGSTDDSVDVIRRRAADIAYWVSERDRGQAHALNKALAHATGDIVGWLNSDDRYLPGAFDRIVRAFAARPDALVVHGDRLMIDRDDGVIGWTALPPFAPAAAGYAVCSEAAFWRRAPAAGVAFDENLRFAMDLDFFCRLFRLGPFVKLDDYLGAFRCYSDNKSSTLQDVCRAETEARWNAIFPEHRDRWRVAARSPTRRLAMELLRHPRLIAAPYLYRRFVRGLRGVTIDPPAAAHDTERRPV